MCVKSLKVLGIGHLGHLPYGREASTRLTLEKKESEMVFFTEETVCAHGCQYFDHIEHTMISNGSLW